MSKIKVGDRVRLRYTNELGTVVRCTSAARKGYRRNGFVIPSLPACWGVELDGGEFAERQDWRLRVVDGDQHCCSWGICDRNPVYINKIGGESVHFIPQLSRLVQPLCGHHAKDFLKRMKREGETLDRLDKEAKP